MRREIDNLKPTRTNRIDELEEENEDLKHKQKETPQPTHETRAIQEDEMQNRIQSSSLSLCLMKRSFGSSLRRIL
jgi:hypothetical protein